MRVGAIAIIFGMLGTLSLTSVVNAGNDSPNIRADLEGRPIKVAEISSYYCHDFAFPLIHCFSTAAELEAASVAPEAAIAVAFGPADFVTVYSEPTYGGSYMHMSQNYDNLFWIGWSDRISSLKARNGASGTFWSDWYGNGQRTNFCCNQTIPFFAAATDNTFTSVYRN